MNSTLREWLRNGAASAYPTTLFDSKRSPSPRGHRSPPVQHPGIAHEGPQRRRVASRGRGWARASPPRLRHTPPLLRHPLRRRHLASSPTTPIFHRPAQELPPAEAEVALARLETDFVRTCAKCRLHEHRRQAVFGVGHSRAELVFVGEGPGAEEDAQGLPFVGRAGQLLTRMIAAMTLTREQVYICNVVKCRPPDNRTPAEDEMKTCTPYLFRQLAILRPGVIVTLGRPASQTLLASKVPISRLRGQLHDFPPPALAHLGLPTAKLMPTFHPAYLLRSPGEKAKAWQDLQTVMRFLGLEIPTRR